MTPRAAPGDHVAAPDYALAGLCMALAFAVQLPFVSHQAVLLDEGVILQMADDIANGKAPYRDGVHYAFPGVFYLTAAVFEVFGPSLEAARVLAASLFVLTTGAALLICRWWCTRPETIFFFLIFLSYRIWAFPHWHMLNYSPLAVTMAVVAAWAAGEHIARTGYRWAAVAGVFCGLATLAKQDSGGATAIALGIAMLALRPAEWRDRLNSAVTFSAATSLVVLACLAAVWKLGFLEDLVREAIFGPLYGAANYEYLGRPSLLPFLSQDAHLRANNFSYFPQIFMETYGQRLLNSTLYRDWGVVDAATKLLYHAPWMIAGAAGLYLLPAVARSGASTETRRRALALLMVFAFLLAFNRPHDWIHLLVLYPPTLFLVVSAVPLLRQRPIARATLAFLCVGFFAASTHLALEFRQLHSEPVKTERGTFHTRPELAGGFRDILAAIGRTPVDTPLLAYPYHPFLNFLANRPGATRYLFLWPVEWNDKRDDEIIAVLEARPDTTVLYSLTQLVHLGSPRHFAAKLYRYLADNYEIARTYGISTRGLSFLQLRRRPAVVDGSLLAAVENRSTITKQPRNGVATNLTNGREKFLRVVDWPFRRTATLKTQPAAEVALRIPYAPRVGDRLSSSYATNPEHWEYIFTPPVRFRLAVATDDGSERTLIEREVTPGNNAAQRRWFNVEIDLSPWAGQSIDIVLGVFTRWGTKPSFQLAGWEIPNITRCSAGGCRSAPSEAAPASKDPR